MSSHTLLQESRYFLFALTRAKVLPNLLPFSAHLEPLLTDWGELGSRELNGDLLMSLAWAEFATGGQLRLGAAVVRYYLFVMLSPQRDCCHVLCCATSGKGARLPPSHTAQTLRTALSYPLGQR